MTQIPTFVIDKSYSRKDEITGKFGGSAQSGIAPSKKSPVVFLFTGSSGEQFGYTDSFTDPDCLLYTGEGQLGDMTMSRGNLAIASHAADGRALHVFEMTGKGMPCIYRGEYSYGSHFVERGLDREGSERNVIRFRLIPVAKMLQSELDSESDSHYLEDEEQESSELSLTDLRKAAIAACEPQAALSNFRETIRRSYQRSVQVKRYVLARSKGCCELCGNSAPFIRKSDRTPYLEPHHINRLSDGGLDHPRYVGALCPTCHRQIHFGVDGQLQNERLRAKVESIETDASRK